MGISIQLALDIAIASGSFNLSSFLMASRDLPLNWLWAFGSAFVGSYYGEKLDAVSNPNFGGILAA